MKPARRSPKSLSGDSSSSVEWFDDGIEDDELELAMCSSDSNPTKTSNIAAFTIHSDSTVPLSTLAKLPTVQGSSTSPLKDVTNQRILKVLEAATPRADCLGKSSLSPSGTCNSAFKTPRMVNRTQVGSSVCGKTPVIPNVTSSSKILVNCNLVGGTKVNSGHCYGSPATPSIDIMTPHIPHASTSSKISPSSSSCAITTPLSRYYPPQSHSTASTPLPSLMKRTPPLCDCGCRAKRKFVQSPGPNIGRCFFSCGSGSRSSGCKFFKWESAVETPSPRSPSGRTVGNTPSGAGSFWNTGTPLSAFHTGDFSGTSTRVLVRPSR